MPRKARILETRPCSTTLPSRSSTLTAWFGLTEPEVMRPVMMRPRKGLASRSVPIMRNGPSRPSAPAHASARGRTAAPCPGPSGPSGFSAIQPCGRAVEDREVELLVGGVERGEEVEHLVDDFGGAGVGTVDLVDRDDRASGRPSAPCRRRTSSAASGLRRRRPARSRRPPC
jgi:hypothetical protein